jgi:hypothetical protein
MASTMRVQGRCATQRATVQVLRPWPFPSRRALDLAKRGRSTQLTLRQRVQTAMALRTSRRRRTLPHPTSPEPRRGAIREGARSLAVRLARTAPARRGGVARSARRLQNAALDCLEPLALETASVGRSGLDRPNPPTSEKSRARPACSAPAGPVAGSTPAGSEFNWPAPLLVPSL